MSSASAKAFINQIAPIIQREAKARGYKVCSAIIAQAVIESRYGESGLAKYHNYFGMKCGNSWKGKSVNLSTKEEYTPGQLTTIKDNFRVYDSMEEGVKGYFDFISTNRYSNLKSAESAQVYLERIKADGYATSSRYVQTNIDCIRKYDLYKWDWNNMPVSYPVPERTLKRGMKGDDVKWLQDKLANLGYEIGSIDGIFGVKTETALRAFQSEVFVDGILGKMTLGKIK